MSIDFECPYCQNVIKVSDDKGGKQTNCPSCQQPVAVPEGGVEDLRIVEPGKAGRLLAEVQKKKIQGRACPACGSPLPEDASRCPRCHVDPNAVEKISRVGVAEEKSGPSDAPSQGMPFTVKIVIAAALAGLAYLIVTQLSGS